MFIDAHCHLSDARIVQYLSEVLERSRTRGVRKFVQAGVDPRDWQNQLALARINRDIYPCFGLHPYFVSSHEPKECDKALQQLEKLLPQSLALGETGLDFRTDYLERGKDHQIDFFKKQLTLAKKHQKIPVLHIVKGHSEAQLILQKARPELFVVHAFNSSPSVAEKYLELNGYLSIGGAVLDPKNTNLREALRIIPSNRILVESDTPDQPPPNWPHPFNEPWCVIQVTQEIARLQGLSPETLESQIESNIRNLWDII